MFCLCTCYNLLHLYDLNFTFLEDLIEGNFSGKLIQFRNKRWDIFGDGDKYSAKCWSSRPRLSSATCAENLSQEPTFIKFFFKGCRAQE